MSSSKNLEQEKTSFLNKSNSAFIEDMYIRFIENDPNLPGSWKKYFETLDDDIQSVIKEIEGPTWQPKKKKINVRNSPKQYNKHSEASKNESIKTISLIRAYRIRGHLIANLDPLGMMNREYIHDLHPKTTVLKKKIMIKKYF